MQLLAPRDVGRLLGVTTGRVQQLDREGKLRAMRDSAGRRVYDEATVRRFLEARLRQVKDSAAQSEGGK